LVDLTSALIGGVGGAVLGIVVGYVVFYMRPKNSNPVRIPTREPMGRLTVSTISSSELDRSRREMRTMMVERDLLSSAMMKLYEAENEGRITRDERESIAKRYGDQIKSIQNKLKDVELVVEVGELEKLREDILGMFEEKIQNIEARLDTAKERLMAVAPEVVAQSKKEAPIPVSRVEPSTELERVVAKRTKPEMSESERMRKELADEVMETVSQLEQMDIERKPQEPN